MTTLLSLEEQFPFRQDKNRSEPVRPLSALVSPIFSSIRDRFAVREPVVSTNIAKWKSSRSKFFSPKKNKLEVISNDNYRSSSINYESRIALDIRDCVKYASQFSLFFFLSRDNKIFQFFKITNFPSSLPL